MSLLQLHHAALEGQGLRYICGQRHGVKQIRACGFFHLFPYEYTSFRIDSSQCDDRSWFVLEESGQV